MTRRLFLTLTLLAMSTACGDDYDDSPSAPVTPAPAPQIVTGAGDITASITAYRALLGEPRNGGAVGPAASGRREIGWDGVPPELDNGDNKFPGAFFNTTTRLGVVMTTTGTGFRNDTSAFADVESTLRDQFAAFSPRKLFAPTNSHVLDVHFQLAGQPTPGLVSGFGAVFVDVDQAERTTIEYFDAQGRSLGRVNVPVRTTATPFSFAGVRFPQAIVARVRITLGTAALAAGRRDVSAGGTADLVVVDDFLYGEPQPVS